MLCGIHKIRQYQKAILRYNYTTGILLNTNITCIMANNIMAVTQKGVQVMIEVYGCMVDEKLIFIK